MAAKAEDEESLLASDRASEAHCRRLEKTSRWQARQHSRFQLCGVRSGVATFMTLTVFVMTYTILWLLYAIPF